MPLETLSGAGRTTKTLASRAASAQTVDPVSTVISSDRAHIPLSIRNPRAYPTGTVTLTSNVLPTIEGG